jgi:hypothetical protein
MLSAPERLAARPPVEQLLAKIRDRKITAKTRVFSKEILAHRNADRR